MQIKINRIRLIILTTIALGTTLSASAETPDQLSPAELFTRCYSLLTRVPPPLNDSRLVSLRATTATLKTAEDQCISLLNKGLINPSTHELKTPNDFESRAIIETFQRLHSSWFQNQRGTLNRPEDLLIYDWDEPGLFWTRALFLPNTKASSVVTYNKSLRGLRQRAVSNSTPFQARYFFNYFKVTDPIDKRASNMIPLASQTGYSPLPGYAFIPDNDPYFRIAYLKDLKLPIDVGSNYLSLILNDNQITAFGELIGINDQAPLVLPRLFFNANLVGNAQLWTMMSDVASNYNKDIDVHGHPGGGALGSVVYAMKNTNFDNNSLAKSYSTIDRRLASRYFKDFLCVNLPTLTSEDVSSLVDPNSSFAFKRSTSCMRCHATFDELALMQRNYTWRQSGNAAFGFPALIGTPADGLPNNPGSPGATIFARYQFPHFSDDERNFFHLTSPRGKLFFRTLNQTLVNVPVNSYSELGAEMARQPDFYNCAAKRYYQYFTGINVSIDNSTVSSIDQAHKSFVLNLGLTLKNDPNQSLLQLVSSIIKSEAFKSRSFKVMGVEP